MRKMVFRLKKKEVFEYINFLCPLQRRCVLVLPLLFFLF